MGGQNLTSAPSASASRLQATQTPEPTASLLESSAIATTQAYMLIDFGGDSPIPVELAAFDAVAEGDHVELTWTTLSETNNAGFDVQHQPPAPAGVDSVAWRPVTFVEGQGTASQPHRYRHQVPGLTPGRHRFRLKQIDFDGAFEYSPEVDVTIEMAVTHRISAVYPNPFNPSARFTVTVQQTQPVRVAVFDVLGRERAVLHEGSLEGGAVHPFTVAAQTWPSGLYYVVVQGEQFRETRPMTVLK